MQLEFRDLASATKRKNEFFPIKPLGLVKTCGYLVESRGTNCQPGLNSLKLLNGHGQLLLNLLDFSSATMKAGRDGMSLDWTQTDLREGLRCFHSGAFFEAHEHWESVWLMAEEPEKTFLQGLIQVAAAFHHFQRGNCAGTISLLRSALRRLDGYAPAFAGIAVEPLCTTIRLWLEALETVSPSPPPPLPQLQLAERGSPP